MYMPPGLPPPPPPKARSPDKPADAPPYSAGSPASGSSVAAAAQASLYHAATADDDSRATSEAETYVEDEWARAAEPSHAGFDAPRQNPDMASANRAAGQQVGGSGDRVAKPLPPPKAGPPSLRQQALATVPLEEASLSHDGSSIHWLPLGQNGQLVLCLSCQQTELLQHAANILDAALASLPGIAADRGAVREETLDAWTQGIQIIRAQAEWRDESFALKLSFKSTAAMGLGSNVQKRTRTSRLAMALALICDYPKISTSLFKCYAGLEQLATRVWKKRSEAPAAMPAIEGGSAVASACSSAPLTAPAPHRTPPANAVPQNFRQRAAAAGVPDDCLDDPFLELRQNNGWDQGFCAACGKFIDSWHITTGKHQKYLLDVPGTLAWLGTTGAQLESMRASPPLAKAPPARITSAAGDLWSPSQGVGRPPPSLPPAPAQPAPPPQPPKPAEVPLPPPPTKEEMCRFFMQFASRLGLQGNIINVDDDDFPLADDPPTVREVIDV